MQFGFEIGLVILLLVTLVQAIRLERALGVLRRARAGLEPLVEEFDSSTRQAEAAIARLHEAAESAGRQVGRQTDTATSLKDDLAFLVERGDRLADRIDGLIRSARPLAAGPRLVVERQIADSAIATSTPAAPVRGRTGRTPALVSAANESRAEAEHVAPTPPQVSQPVAQHVAQPVAQSGPRVRSQAERDLLKALRVAR